MIPEFENNSLREVLIQQFWEEVYELHHICLSYGQTWGESLAWCKADPTVKQLSAQIAALGGFPDAK